MINRLVAENYAALRRLAVSLSPLTVFVGPNASGKTTVLRALTGAVGPTWRSSPDARVSILLAIGDNEKMSRSWGARRPNEFEGKWPAVQSLVLDPVALRQPSVVSRQSQLLANGANIANLLASLGRRRLESFAEVFCSIVPVFKDVDVQPVKHQNGVQTVVFEDRWQPGLWYEPAEVSDGTMLMLAFLALRYQETAPDLLLIEEPERALHPYLLTELIGALRKLTTGEFGHTTQVVMATHSTELVDRVNPEEVRFLSRNPEDGSVIASEIRTDDPNWEKAFAEYRESLSEVWLSGAAGGVPS